MKANTFWIVWIFFILETWETYCICNRCKCFGLKTLNLRILYLYLSSLKGLGFFKNNKLLSYCLASISGQLVLSLSYGLKESLG